MKCCSSGLEKYSDNDLFTHDYMCMGCKSIYSLCIICKQYISFPKPRNIILHFAKKHNNNQMTAYVFDVMLIVDANTHIGINYIVNTFPYIISLSINDFQHEFTKKIMNIIRDNIDHVKVTRSDFYPTTNPIICGELFNLFTHASYSCTFCGMNYDCFMPSLNLVSSHIKNSHK